MSYSIKKNRITLTRGDTLKVNVSITTSSGEEYIPEEGDRIRFALKKDVLDEEPLILKEIPIDTLVLQLNPEDTKSLPFDKYVYDLELTKASGEVDTFITKTDFILSEEVH